MADHAYPTGCTIASAAAPKGIHSIEMHQRSNSTHRSQPKSHAFSVETPTPHLQRSSLHRRRGRSFSSRSSPLPLTRENLRHFEESTMRIPRNPSPTRVTGAVDDENQLTGYNITVFKGIKPPKVLADFVSRLTESRHQEPSPHAQSIIGTQKAALTTNEITAQIKMEEHVLFRGETYPDGIPGLTLQKQVNLVKDFLPDPPYPAVPALWGSLALPQPDSCIGYITAMEAAGCTPVLTMPLTKEEDAIAAWYNVVHHAVTHFPFLTAQWKCASSGEGHLHASIQGAREGALIVNYMHQFYSTTYPGRDPTPLETCHFSVTIEGYTIMIWMHWREVHPENGEIYFRMEIVHRAFLDVLTDMLEFRKILHNYVDYAMGERLRSIKEALPVFWSNLQKNKGGASKSQSVATTSVSELPPDLRRSMPVFPSSSAGESASGDVVPTKKTKRKRTA